VARSVTHFVALVSLAAGVAGCGEVGYRGAVPLVHTQSFRTEPASPLAAGVDGCAITFGGKSGLIEIRTLVGRGGLEPPTSALACLKPLCKGIPEIA